MDKKLTYLACPYTSDDAELMNKRFDDVCLVAGGLMKTTDKVIYSPISHCHPIAMQTSLPTGWKFWERIDRTYLEYCCEMIVLTLPGWEESTGVQAEIKIAEELGIPIAYINGSLWIP